MKDLKVKVSTIARIASLVLALVNQVIALVGKGSLPFTENMGYQFISVAATVITAGINCWYNQDITKGALLAGKIFDAYKDGKITEKELEEIAEAASEKGVDVDGN